MSLADPHITKESSAQHIEPLKQRVKGLDGYTFWDKSPVAALYSKSKEDAGSHSEGFAALTQILALRQRQESSPTNAKVASAKILSDRLSAILDYAEVLFGELEEVEAIAVFGSILWKESPGDFDTVTYTNYEEISPLSDYFDRVMNSVEARVTKEISKSLTIPDDICGIKRNPDHIFVCSNNHAPLPPGASVVNEGPYLVIIRGEESASNSMPVSLVFFNSYKPYRDNAAKNAPGLASVRFSQWPS